MPPVQRTRNRERTRGSIVAAARAEFAARGYAGARMEQIAQRAGVKKELIYHYFRGKEQLFEEVRTSQLADAEAGHALPPSPLTDRARDPSTLFAWRFNRMLGDLEWIKLLTWEAVQTDVAPPPNEDTRRATIRQSIAAIKTAQKDGALPSDLDARFLQLAMFALATYPLAFAQITAMTTGMAASDKRFQTAWVGFLQQLGERLLAPAPAISARKARTASKGKA
jgi:AcrR family transcriptional regulator